MAIEFNLPEVSEGVTSVDIAEFHVSEGDVITAGTIVCEVETDKAVAEIPCPYAGRVAKVLVGSGDTVAVGQPLLVIEAEPAAAPAKNSPPAAIPPAAATPEPAAVVATAASQPAPAKQTAEVEFCLPEVSEGVTQVYIAAVNLAVGDAVSKGAVVCEVETDKAVAEIPCPFTGTVTAVHVQAGSTVSIGAPLITVQTTTSAAAPATAPAAAPEVAAPADPPRDGNAEPPGANAPVTAPAVSTAAASRPDVAPAPAGPATRRLARKLGVDLHQVNGSARGGRITIEDVEGWVRNRLASANVPSSAPAGPGFGIVQAAPMPDFSKFGPVEKQPMNRIFRTAASNLHAAWVTIPHVTQHDLADITELEAARKRYVKGNPNAPKITMTAIIIKAVVGALKAFPTFNSSVDMESGELVIKQYYHIGVAVDTPNGLVVPVIRDCDQKNILQVASELTEIAVKARDRKLKAEDMQGGTFTITNLGGIGGTGFTPIVNYPEVAILGMSRSIKQVVLDNGQLDERLMLPLSLSYDHRAINGADAARFVVKLSGSLTNFLELF